MTLFVKSERPVDAVTVEIIRNVDAAARDLHLPYFLAGATARDLFLTNVFGIDTGLATRDVDFAVALKDWVQFETFKARLASVKGFAIQGNDMPQRIHYIHKNGVSYPLDLLPFRGVEDERHTIAWPPDMKVMMNVIGYEEALATAVDIQIDERTQVRVASLAGLAVLKLFAWLDRGSETAKDALDLITLFRAYPYAGNQDRIYGEEISSLERVGYDMNLMGPRLLGLDVRRISAPLTIVRAMGALQDTKTREKLAVHMARQLGHASDPLAAAEELLNQFRTGMAGE